MISKRNDSFKQQAFHVTDLSMHFLGKALPYFLCANLTYLALDVLQGRIDQQVIDQCKINIAQIVKTQTMLGDVYACVPRQQIYGPALPLKD
jgi:hypothetical protein